MSLIQYIAHSANCQATQVLSVGRAIVKKEITFYPKYLEKFEKRFADFIGCDYALTFCNGTSAIEAALFAIGIQPGDEVIVPSCTFHASIDPIINAGATPIFADIDEKTLTIDPADAASKITDKTKAIIVVHLFGIPADVDALKSSIGQRKIRIIEDSSHAHGAASNNKQCGALGDIGIFSLQGNKSVASGEGGIAVTHNESLFIRMSLWGHFDRHNSEFNKIGAHDFSLTGLGYKRRMAPLGALLANADLSRLKWLNPLMNKNAEKLDAALAQLTNIQIPELKAGNTRGGFFGGYPIMLKNETKLAKNIIKELSKINIKALAYPFPLHHTLPIYYDPAYRNSVLYNAHPAQADTSKRLTLPKTERIAKEMILLPRKYLIYAGKNLGHKLKSALT